ncbi:MAG: sulfite exporter TauE/SafE family protein [Oscillospiraceae bacterium]|nr:sulfite exporter TauE/SafE family protein [Oscillospiraceae bacterium]
MVSIIYILYAVVVFGATALGSVAGLGGGVIIKPLLDALGFHDIGTISFISTSAVFFMAVISTVKQLKSGYKIHIKTLLFLVPGSVAGGVYGGSLLRSVTALISDMRVVRAVQAIMLMLLLAFSVIVINKCQKTYRLKHPLWILITGLGLGLLSSFLGIGGGPFNLAFLMLLFSMDLKQCTVYSIVIILFSQFSNLFSLYMVNSFEPYDLKLLISVLPAAGLGGYLGAVVNKRISEKNVKYVFNVLVAAIFFICIYNASAVFISI